VKATVYIFFKKWPQSTWLRQRFCRSQILEVKHLSLTNIQRLRYAFFHRWLSADDTRFFKPRAKLFGLGGTAKSRNFAHFRAHRRRVHGLLALGASQVHRLVHHL
jgi:hypothetical protein